LKYTF